MTFISLMAAFNYYPLLQWCFVWIYSDIGAYSGALAFLLSFVIVFLALQQGAMAVLDEHIDLNPILNGLAGAVFGGMSGFLLAGLLAIAWFMMPGSAYFVNPDDEAKVVMGVDETVLTTVRFIANDRLTGSTAFDATHTFMRNNTYKYAKPLGGGGSGVGPGNSRRGEEDGGGEPKANVNAIKDRNKQLEEEKNGGS